MMVNGDTDYLLEQLAPVLENTRIDVENSGFNLVWIISDHQYLTQPRVVSDKDETVSITSHATDEQKLMVSIIKQQLQQLPHDQLIEIQTAITKLSSTSPMLRIDSVKKV